MSHPVSRLRARCTTIRCRLASAPVLRLALLLLALGPGLGPTPVRAQSEEGAFVAAAADLKFALAEVAAAFQRETRSALRITYGSSGNFAQQIRNGAPFELFLSADERYVEDLARDGMLRDVGTVYAIGRIALYAPRGSPVVVDPSLAGLAGAVDAGRVRRFAIANPEHAPYGRAAREALLHAGLWTAIERSLVLGENAAQAMQFAADSDGGIVPYALALNPAAAKDGNVALLPDTWHAPLRQRMALTRRAGPVASRFYAFMQTPSAGEILARHGFALPKP